MGISGSLRAASSNTGLLRAAVRGPSLRATSLKTKSQYGRECSGRTRTPVPSRTRLRGPTTIPFRYQAAFFPKDASFEIVSIAALPLYNGDVEAAGVPPAVKEFTDKACLCFPPSTAKKREYELSALARA